ncbi:MAG: LysR substrate-binding domain-containing protein [Pseudomonadota bacterium]
MDYFAALRAFRAVVEDDGFAPAARRMGLATSSLTRQVNSLEQALGVQLLNRSTRSVTLTDAGQSYLEQTSLILDSLDDANRSISEEGGAPRGLLRVSLPVVFAALHVAPSLGLFVRQYPDIKLDLRLSDKTVNLVDDRIDVAIRIGPLDNANFIAKKLAPHRRVVCASPDYLSEHGVPTHPREIAAHRCLIFDFADGDRTWRFEKDGEKFSLGVDGPIVADNSDVLRQAAISGAGLLMMGSWLIGEDIRAGRLVQVLDGWTAGHRDINSAIHAVYLPNRRGSRKVSAFVDHLIAHFRSPPYWEDELR